MVTLAELYKGTVSLLKEHGIESADFEAVCLLKKTMNIDRLKIMTEPNLQFDPDDEDYYRRALELRELVRRRASGEPLQYILGEWEFYGFPFRVGEGVLIPRQDTETLIDAALPEIKGGMLCADLCAGSGCIGITLARLKNCSFQSYELSDMAMKYLKANIELNGVQGLVKPIFGDVLAQETVESAPMYDVIVTNPPYLTSQDMRELQPEVMREPEMALFGGEDGLDYYRSILKCWTKKLKKGGFFAAEIGMGQETDVMRIFDENGITPTAHKDACGIYRVISGTKK